MSEPITCPTDLVPFFTAKQILQRRFPNTTTKEIAMWAFLGSYPTLGGPLATNKNIINDLAADVTGEWATQEINRGGFKSYYKNDEDKLKTEKLYSFSPDPTEKVRWSDITGNLLLRLFSQSELETFNPADRWISYEEWLSRWAKRCSNEEAEALIEKQLDKNASKYSRELKMRYPVTVIEQTKDECMYLVSEIEAIEKNEFPESALMEGMERGGASRGEAPVISGNTLVGKNKGGRPGTREKKAELLRLVIEEFELATENDFTSGKLPGNCSDFLDACQRLERSAKGRVETFNITEDTLKKWLTAAGFAFEEGRPAKEKAKLWTNSVVKTLAKTKPEVLRDIFSKRGL